MSDFIYEKDIIHQAFYDFNVAIALASSERFIPYMSVMLQSIVDSSSCMYNYDVLILTADISPQSKSFIVSLISGVKNFSVRFINPSCLAEGFSPYLHGHFGNIESYFRLFLPYILPLYDKILYLDSDMVVMSDVAELFAENVDGFLLGACHDADTAGLYNGFQPERKKYTDEVMCLNEPYQYFQGGTLLFNLKEFRATYNIAEVISFAQKEKWLLQDQDVLNKLCEGRVRYVDMAWNVMVDFNGIRVQKIISLAPDWLRKLYSEARVAPKIIHYAGPQKPWNCPDMDFGYLFWRYAKQTDFYETLLFRMMQNLLEHNSKNLKKEPYLVRAFKYVMKRLFRRKS